MLKTVEQMTKSFHKEFSSLQFVLEVGSLQFDKELRLLIQNDEEYGSYIDEQLHYKLFRVAYWAANGLIDWDYKSFIELYPEFEKWFSDETLARLKNPYGWSDKFITVYCPHGHEQFNVIGECWAECASCGSIMLPCNEKHNTSNP